MVFIKRKLAQNVMVVSFITKNDKFTLKEQVTVEYNQPGVNVLNHDNIGIVLR